MARRQPDQNAGQQRGVERVPMRVMLQTVRRIHSPHRLKNPRLDHAESDSQPWLNWMTQKPKIRTSLLSKVWEAPMPHYEFFCHAGKTTFGKIFALLDYQEGRV